MFAQSRTCRDRRRASAVCFVDSWYSRQVIADRRRGSLLGCSFRGSHPSKQEEVASAKGTSVGQENPVERLLDAVSHAHASEIDRSAIRTMGSQHGFFLECQPSVFAALPVDGGRLPRKEGAAPGAFDSLPRAAGARLASRAALICSGVRTSGSDSLTCCFARATCRLCRFASRLSIPALSAGVSWREADALTSSV